MLSLFLNIKLTLSETTSTTKLFRSDCIALTIQLYSITFFTKDIDNSSGFRGRGEGGCDNSPFPTFFLIHVVTKQNFCFFLFYFGNKKGLFYTLFTYFFLCIRDNKYLAGFAQLFRNILKIPPPPPIFFFRLLFTQTRNCLNNSAPAAY